MSTASKDVPRMRLLPVTGKYDQVNFVGRERNRKELQKYNVLDAPHVKL